MGNSEAVLLQKLHINPFDYGLVITDVYDNGSIFDVKVLDLTDDDLFFKFGNALGAISSVCLQTSYPSICSAPHSIATCFKTLVAIAVECEGYSFGKAGPFKAYLADPSAFVSASDGGGAKNTTTAEEPKEEEEEEEIDMGGGMDMFGGDGGGDDY